MSDEQSRTRRDRRYPKTVSPTFFLTLSCFSFPSIRQGPKIASNILKLIMSRFTTPTKWKNLFRGVVRKTIVLSTAAFAIEEFGWQVKHRLQEKTKYETIQWFTATCTACMLVWVPKNASFSQKSRFPAELVRTCYRTRWQCHTTRRTRIIKRKILLFS